VLEKTLINQVIALVLECAGPLRRSSAAGSVRETIGASLSEALHPFSQGCIGKAKAIGSGFDGFAGNHLTHGLSAAKDASLLRLLHEGSQGDQGIVGTLAFERAPGMVPGPL
jgi:hypothetical protein